MKSDRSLPSLGNRTTLATDVARLLRQAILLGRFQPGERLIETNLADELDISRTTLREAFRDLIGEGLIVNRPRRGRYVAELTADDITEIHEMRIALETLAAIKLSKTLTVQQRKRLEKCVQEIQRCSDEEDSAAVNELDMQFHETLCRFSGNDRLLQAWKQMGGQMRLYFAAFQRRQDLKVAARRHALLLNEIVDGDVEAIRHVIEDHITDAANSILADAR